MQKIITRDNLEVKYYTSLGFTLSRKYHTTDNGFPVIEFEVIGVGLSEVYRHYQRNKRQIDLKTINKIISTFNANSSFKTPQEVW